MKKDNGIEVYISVKYFTGPDGDEENEVNATASSWGRAELELKGLQSAVEKELEREANVIPEDEEERDEPESMLRD